MKKHKVTFYFIFLSLLLLNSSINNVYSQLEAKNWYFGNYDAFKFVNNKPVILHNSKLTTNNGSATISDKQGNLLFYTTSKTIWNRNHDTLKNGDGLNTSVISTQGAIIIPKPGNSNLYYVFTVSGNVRPNPGFWYHIIDITKDNGKGEVILKNQFILFYEFINTNA